MRNQRKDLKADLAYLSLILGGLESNGFQPVCHVAEKKLYLIEILHSNIILESEILI